MIPYPLLALVSVLVFALVHLSAEKVRHMAFFSQGKLLSIGGGVAIAYVFVDLLPKLAKSNELVERTLAHVIPYLERHVFVMALVGFLLFFVVGKMPAFVLQQRGFWISIASYAIFNFLVGYAVVDKDDPEVQPLILFTIAMALHYFTNDYSLLEAHGRQYRDVGRWILVVSLLMGWFTGLAITLSETAVALVSAFIGGGVIMNVTRHELPRDTPHSVPSFLLAAAVYTVILLGMNA